MKGNMGLIPPAIGFRACITTKLGELQMPDSRQDCGHGWEESAGYGRPGAPADKLAFVLSGGGALGSVQVGCLQALMEHGIFPDLISWHQRGRLEGPFR